MNTRAKLDDRLVHGVSSCGLTYATEQVGGLSMLARIFVNCVLHTKLIWMHVFLSAGVFEVENISLTLGFAGFLANLL